MRMLARSLAPLLLMPLFACGGEAAVHTSSDTPSVAAATGSAPAGEPQAPAGAMTPASAAAASASPSAPPPDASASAGPTTPNAERSLSTESGYAAELSKRIHDLVKPRCATGWTGSADVEIRDGKITLYETSEGPVPKMIGKTVPKPPKELEGFFAGRVMVGLCAGYISKL
jgi:hypothetical protein